MIRRFFAFALAVIPCTAMLVGCPDETKPGDGADAHASAEPTPKATVPSATAVAPATASATATATIEAADAGKGDAAKTTDAGPVGDAGKPKTK
jgi:hypothetical protein